MRGLQIIFVAMACGSAHAEHTGASPNCHESAGSPWMMEETAGCAGHRG
jgi:hypothetical protein